MGSESGVILKMYSGERVCDIITMASWLWRQNLMGLKTQQSLQTLKLRLDLKTMYVTVCMHVFSFPPVVS